MMYAAAGPERGGTPGHAARRCAALLLEVVIALAIMVAAVGLLSGQLANGLRITDYAESQMQAAQVTDRVLAMIELDPNTQEKLAETEEGQTLEQPVGGDYPGYFYRVRIDPIEPEREDLFVVKVDILRQSDANNLESSDGAELVRQMGFLKAPPARIDATSLGLTPEALAGAGLPPELAEQLPLLMSLLTGGGDASNMSIQDLINSLDPETLSQIIPMIQSLLAQGGLGSGFALDPSMLGGLPGLEGLMGGLSGGLPGGGAGAPGAPGAGSSSQDLAELIRNRAGAAGGAGGRAAAAPQTPPNPSPQPMPRRGGGGRAGRGGSGPGAGSPPPAGGPQTPSGLPRSNQPRGGSGASAPPRAPNPNMPALPPGGGTGEGGRYTIEDLMRMRDEMQGGGG